MNTPSIEVLTGSDEARKLNGLMLEVWACTKPHPEVTPEMLRKLLGRCLPFIRAAAVGTPPPESPYPGAWTPASQPPPDGIEVLVRWPDRNSVGAWSHDVAQFHSKRVRPAWQSTHLGSCYCVPPSHWQAIKD
jgi:hypothetical protein